MSKHAFVRAAIAAQLVLASWGWAAPGAWGPPFELDPSGRPGPGPARLAVDRFGAVTAVWTVVEAGEHSVRARTLSGDAWGPLQVVAAEAGPRLMLSDASPAGDLLAAWSNSMTLHKGEIWASWLRKGRGWTPPERVDTPGYKALSVESAEVSSDGRGLVIFTCWPQPPQGDAQLCRRLFEPGKGWSANVSSDRQDPFSYLAPEREASSAEGGGQLLQVWVAAYPEGGSGVYARRYADGKMGEPEVISRPSGGTVAFPQVALGRAGGFAGWAQSSRGGRGPGWARVQAARYDAVKGWLPPQDIDLEGGGASASPSLAAGDDGSAVAVWSKEGRGRGSSAIFASAYAPDRGWGRPEFVGIDRGRAANQPEVLAAPRGRRILVWKEWDGTRERLWSRVWTPPTPRAP